jgi:ABC-2 type transport system permease protein
MGMLADIDRGVLDRLLATPVARGALLAARILYSAAQVAVQSAIILLVSAAIGARPHGGAAGVALVLLVAALLGAAFGAVSNALALLTRRQELVIAVMNFIVLPSTFLSSMMMSGNLMPAWIRSAAMFNPVNWAVVAARGSFEGNWALLPRNLGLLAAFALVAAWLATRSFDRYRRAG